MISRASLIDTENKVRDLNIRIEQIEKQGGFKKWFFLNKLKKKLKKYEIKHFYTIDKFLLKEDQEYQNIARNSYELLENPEIRFSVYTTSMSLIGSYSKRIRGRLRNNGHSYSYSDNSNFDFTPFDSFGFPAKLKGLINHWGELDLHAAKIGHRFWKTLPKEFVGTISKNGVIELDNVKNDYEILNSGRLTIGKLIANHFGNDKSKRVKFNQNKAALLRKIESFRKNLSEN